MTVKPKAGSTFWEVYQSNQIIKELVKMPPNNSTVNKMFTRIQVETRRKTITKIGKNYVFENTSLMLLPEK